MTTSSEVGLAGGLYEGCLDLLIALRWNARENESLTAAQDTLLSKQLERLFLWGDGFGASKGDLDSVLVRPDCSRLNVLAVKLLSAIGYALIDDLVPIIMHDSSDDKALQKLLLIVTGWLEKAEYLKVDDLCDSGRGDSDSESSDYEIGQKLADGVILTLATYIDCLSDCIPALEQAVHRCDFPLQSLIAKKSVPADLLVSDVARPYCRRILDKFPKATTGLVERLGEANAKRHKRIREGYRDRTYIEDNEQGEDFSSDVEEDKPISLADTTFHDSAIGTSVDTSNLTKGAYGAAVPSCKRVSPESSLATLTSFLTDDNNSSSLRVPPLPREAQKQKSFICVACERVVSNIANSAEWKEHIFSDLQPYMCTFEDCANKTTFMSRRDWWNHEKSSHWKKTTWGCSACLSELFRDEHNVREHIRRVHQPQQQAVPMRSVTLRDFENQLFEYQLCPLCNEKAGSTEVEFAKHVGKHMEEIALAVLPCEIEEDLSDYASADDCSACSEALSRKTDIDESNLATLQKDVVIGQSGSASFPVGSHLLTPFSNQDRSFGALTSISYPAKGIRSEEAVSKGLSAQPIEDRNYTIPKQDEPDADGAFSAIFSKLRKNPESFMPTVEDFKDSARLLYPQMHPSLRNRIAQELLERLKSLVVLEINHYQDIKIGYSCTSGKYCTELGGAPEYISFPNSGGKKSMLDNTGSPTEHQVYPSDDKNALTKGLITPAQFWSHIPMPPVMFLPATFECSICFEIKHCTNPSDWEKHVHEDLIPFICTFVDCASENKSFKRKADWARHENERHRQLEWWVCCMSDCSVKCYRKDNFAQHLTREHKLQDIGPSNSHLTPNEIWKLVEKCRRETAKKPEDEACRFCGASCSSWKKLTAHLAKHLERTFAPVLTMAKEKQV